MYQSDLHSILRGALERTIWIRSTKDEDNYRQVICSEIYEKISPNNVEIPSTRSSKGDIKIFGRKIELKYASSEKTVPLDQFLDDFDLLIEGKIEFSIISIRVDVSDPERFIHRSIPLPMLKKSGASIPFGIRTTSTGLEYCGFSVFLPTSFPHEPKAVTMRTGKGKNATAYLSFARNHEILRSSVLAIGETLIHVDVLGSREDGLIMLLFKQAESIEIEKIPKSEFTTSIPYAPKNIVIAKGYFAYVNAKWEDSMGFTGDFSKTKLESSIPVFEIEKSKIEP